MQFFDTFFLHVPRHYWPAIYLFSFSGGKVKNTATFIAAASLLLLLHACGN